MTLDTSAVVAMLRNEPERAGFIQQLEQADRRIISSVSVLEAAMVGDGIGRARRR